MVILDDYESGSLSNEYTVNDSDFEIKSNRVFNGSFSVGIEDTSDIQQEDVCNFNPTELSGGEQPDKIRWYWQEDSSSFGGGIRIRDSSGNTVGGFVTNNPQWVVQTGSSTFEEIYDGGGNYDDWILFEMSFDYANNEITYFGENQDTGATASVTRSGVNNFSDVETIDFMDFTGNDYDTVNFAGNNNDMVMWFDDLEATGLSTTSADVSFNNISQIQIDGADFEGQVDSQNDATDADLGFDVFDAGSGNLVSSITAESNVDLTTKTLPYVFNDDIDTLSSSTSYDVQAFADTSGGKFTSAQQGFTTEDFKTLDFTDGFETFTTASSGNKRREISFDLNVNSSSVPNTSFEQQIIQDIISSIENGTNSDLQNGVVLDNGTILHEDSLSENINPQQIDATFAVTAAETGGSSNTITDFQIEDNNGNVYWQSQLSISGGQDVILRVSFVAR